MKIINKRNRLSIDVILLYSILMFAAIFLFITFSSATPSQFGYNYLDQGSKVQTGANYTINVNNTDHFGGYTVTGYRTWLQSFFDGIYCKLTGCTMTGDIQFANSAIKNVNYIAFNTSYINTGLEPISTTYWDTAEGTTSTKLYNGVTLQNGEELYFYGKASGDIRNGQAVQFAGVQGDHILIKTVNVTEVTTFPQYFIGIATDNIANGNFGYATWFGKVNDVYTQYPENGDNQSWSAGDILYVSMITGNLTKTEPSAPQRKIIAAAVIKEQSGGAENGKIVVRPTFNNKLTDLDDVDGTPLTTSGQILVWNQTGGFFDPNYNIENYVPYIGATSNVNLNGKNITNVGNLCLSNGTNCDGLINFTNASSTFVPYTGAIYNVSLGNKTLSTTSGIITSKIYPSSDSVTAIQLLKAGGATSVMDIDTTNSRVGIGTDSPSQKLEVYTTTTDKARIRITGNGTSNSNYLGIEFFGKDGNTGTHRGGVYMNENTSRLSFWTSTNERLSILQTGYVGININNPTYFTDIRATSTASQLHFGSSSDDSGGYLTTASANNFFVSGGSAYNGAYWVAKSTGSVIQGAGAGGTDGLYTIYTNAGLTAGNSFTPTERLRITSGGRMGLGSTNPDTIFTIYNNTSSATWGTYPSFTVDNPNTVGTSYSTASWKAGTLTYSGVAGIVGQVVAYANNNAGQTFTLKSFGNAPLKLNANGSTTKNINLYPNGNVMIGLDADSGNGLKQYQNISSNALAYFQNLNGDGYGVLVGTADAGNDKYALGVSTGASSNAFFVTNAGRVGINTSSPSYPLEVNSNVSNISIYSQAQISATGYITRTEVNNDSNVLETFKTGNNLLNNDGSINHSAFDECFVSYPVTDYSRPVYIDRKEQNCTYPTVCEDSCIADNEGNVTCTNECLQKQVCTDVIIKQPTYPYTKIEEGVDIVCQQAKQTQALALLNQVINVPDNSTLDTTTLTADYIYTKSKVPSASGKFFNFFNSSIYNKITHYAYKVINGKGLLDGETRWVGAEGYLACDRKCTEQSTKWNEYKVCKMAC